jgi:cytochrome c oxidase subunit II
MSHDQSALSPASDRSQQIADLWWVLFGVSLVVFAVVAMLVLLAVLRARGRREPGRGESRPVKALILGGGVLVPTVVLVVLFGLNVRTLSDASAETKRAQLEIDVTGRQWFWDVRYPASGAVTANELHIPVGVPVRINVRTADVIHSFWVPSLDRKIDMIPGRENSIAFKANKVGVFRGQCAEFCGLQHANMAFLVYVDSPAGFRRWLAAAAKPAAVPTTADERRGLRVFTTAGCSGCHAIAGTSAKGELGPDLTHLAGRRWLAAGTIPNTEGYLAGWILDPQHDKPGNRMPSIPLAGNDLQALLAYLESLG